MTRRPPISVVVPTRNAWPALEPVLDALRPQLAAAGGELVVVDGSSDGGALDPSHQVATIPTELTRMIPSPGSDLFELRALGLTAANGEIVAMTEDHAEPAFDYVAAVLRAHKQHAEPAIAGALTNGSTDTLMDRASFLLTHARNLPPRDSLPGPGWVPTPSNISYKRDAIPTSVPERGWLETVHNVELLHAKQVAFDDRIMVRHFQSYGTFGTFRHHFRAGKCMGGLARTAIGGRAAQLRWGLRSSVTLPALLVRPIWELRRRSTGYRRSVLPLLPIAAAVSTADAVGLALGVIAGPGRSTDLMH